MDDLREFKDYMDYQCKDRTSHYAASSRTRGVPLKNLIKELFTPTDRDNQDITNILGKLTAIGIQELLYELVDDNKATHKYISISGS